MNGPSQTYWRWPGWPRLGYTLLLSCAQGLWFTLIYGGADRITAQHSYRVRVHLDIETAIPFVPASVVGYMSLYLLFSAAPFILRTRRELEALTFALAAVTLAAGPCFLLLPVETAFPDAGELGAWTGPVRFAKQLALRNNCFPSLHFAFAVVCVSIFARQAALLGKAVLWLWAGGIAASTLLLHQHYVLDLVGGFLLALAGVWLVYDRLTKTDLPRREPNASAQPSPGSRAAGLMFPAR
ncbi:MAG TPA: phosphatase PAP2 family protein [Gemmataceae bacterium]|nr:phosphatase PAP2 family protein [Gemmataceae bacterium]